MNSDPLSNLLYARCLCCVLRRMISFGQHAKIQFYHHIFKNGVFTAKMLQSTLGQYSRSHSNYQGHSSHFSKIFIDKRFHMAIVIDKSQWSNWVLRFFLQCNYWLDFLKYPMIPVIPIQFFKTDVCLLWPLMFYKIMTYISYIT